MKWWWGIINFFMYFIVFAVVFIVSFNAIGWLIKKTDLDNKLADKINKYRHLKLILVLIFFAFTFSCEYIKTSLNESFGQHNVRSIILGAILSCIYVKCAPFIFAKNR